ncbi:hypothetical protein GCM10010247_31260 [Streptomyces calvus]|nr:hypothetical protein GCM10010247_31260 [Streptomyces calvus]
MHEVVQDGHLEDAQQLGLGVVRGELHGVVIRGDAWDEAEDSDQEEDRAHDQGGLLYRGSGSVDGTCMCGHGNSLFRL